MSAPGLDPVSLQVLVGALRAACDEMGAILVRSAHSPNIRERRDCSTALFDPGGELVMQAEHIPVHLGSMPDAVAAVLDEEQPPGGLWILNDPYRGGTHLPDITLISPLHDDGRLIGFAASRAHHADVGGPTPGGMPAYSRTLDEEGVVIPPTRATDEVLVELAGQMRAPAQRLADLRAQRAANRAGATRVAELVERLGREGLASRNGGDPRLRRAPHPRGDRRAPGRGIRGDRPARGRPGRLPGHRAALPCDGSPATVSSSTSTAARSRSRATSTARSR